MQLGFRVILPCDPQVAWRAMHTRSIGARLPLPLAAMHFHNQNTDLWRDGDAATVTIRLGGLVPVGTQRIVIEDLPDAAGRRTMRDVGRPLSGMLAHLTRWEHEMSVEPGSVAGTTLWCDRVEFEGRTEVLAAAALWPLWQWRKMRLRLTAARWRDRPRQITV